MNVQVPHGIEQDGIVFRPVVEGRTQRGIEQRFAVGGGLPTAESRALADLYPRKDKAVVKRFTVRNQPLLHHDQVEIPPAVKNFFYRHPAAAILCHKAVGQLGGGHPQRMVRRHRFKSGGHRIFPIGRVAGVEHDVGHIQHIGCQSTGNARKVVNNGIGAVPLQFGQHRLQIGLRFVQEQKRHRGGHVGFVGSGFPGMGLHPGGHRHEPGPGGFHNAPEGLGAKIGHPHAPVHQFGDQLQGGVHVAKGSQRNNGNMHNRQLLPNP